MQVRNIQSCKTCSERSFPDSTLARDEDLIVNCVHSYVWGHHRRLQQACRQVLKETSKYLLLCTAWYSYFPQSYSFTATAFLHGPLELCCCIPGGYCCISVSKWCAGSKITVSLKGLKILYILHDSMLVTPKQLQYIEILNYFQFKLF